MPPILARWWGWTRALAPFVAATACGYRPIANKLRRRALAIKGGLYSYAPLDVNGAKQWLLIRARDIANPVVLYLHGGPGASHVPQYRHYQLPWEDHFTVVHWEQRGAGKSYTSNLPLRTLTVEQLIDDALTVIAHLRERFGQPIVVLGHSWGTLLGT